MKTKPVLQIKNDLQIEINELETQIAHDWKQAKSPLEKAKIWADSTSQRWSATSEHRSNGTAFQAWKQTDIWIQAAKPALTQQTLFELNQRVTGQKSPSQFRSTQAVNPVISFAAPDVISDEIKRILESIKQLPAGIVTGAYLIQELLTVHPFQDGNGRASRLFLDLYLLTHDYPPPVYEGSKDMLVANSRQGAKQFPLEHSVLLLALALERRLPKINP